MKRSRWVRLTLISGMVLALGYIFGGCGSSGTWEAERDIDIPGTILFSTNRGGTWNLIISDFSGEHPNIITEDITGEHRWGIWSNDGQKIYLSSMETDEWDLCVIDDISDPVGSWEKLLDADGDQMYPILTPEGSELVYLNKAPGEYVPCLYMFDLTSETVTALTGQLDVKEMEFIPGTRNLMVLVGYSLQVLNIDTATIQAYIFNTDAGNGYRHDSFCLTPDGLGYCAGRELNRNIYSLGMWDLSDPEAPERLVDAKKSSAINFWYYMTVFEDVGDEYILLGCKPDMGSYQRWIGVIDIAAANWTVKFVSGAKTMDNIHPDWTSVEHF